MLGVVKLSNSSEKTDKVIKVIFFISGIIYFLTSILDNFYSVDWMFWLNILAFVAFVLSLLFTYANFSNRKYVNTFIFLTILVPMVFSWIYKTI